MINKLKRFKEIINNKTIICFTSDIDWASEFAINSTIEFFNSKKIPLTMFLTHKSEVVAKALNDKKIKAGLHPNFMPDSSQGKDYKQVIDFCFDIFPDSIGYRSHRYYSVNDTVEMMIKRGIKFESNVCTLLDDIPPYLNRNGIIEFPIFFEDGAYLLNNKEIDFSNFKKEFLSAGLKVINIHPMHLMLNTPYFKYTREIKDRLSREEWNNLTKESIDKISYKGENGIKKVITDMVEAVNENNIETMYMEDIYNLINTL